MDQPSELAKGLSKMGSMKARAHPRMNPEDTLRALALILAPYGPDVVEDAGDDYVKEGNPYAIRKDNTIVKRNSGKVVSHHENRKKALSAFRLLEGVEHGLGPTGKK